MALPSRQPKKLSLGSLETEILEILWQRGQATAREIHEHILADPDRELACASVTTVLNRLTEKGWLARYRQQRSFVWQPVISQQEAASLLAHQQLKAFLAVGNPDTVAAFADELDASSISQLEAIMQRLKTIRQDREDS
ncbi:MAG: MarR family transcriptional regulator [Leptolyngbyaceae cyanobacterium SM1_1_3]|nr:MarR family transcriptional regulator [Leptolyngbyaceae cyanobacterium SM1_1_3]NJN02776.1 MarR family transcriptional regulator [Leptolyngbyaceae cyanobacterium RM1_1_2]NJO09322.1 MarR family transcriptional regulator [Leptolyngbyaceae cyanobacterium SL_1_1]